MLEHNDARDAGDQESAKCTVPSIPEKAGCRRDAKADQNSDRLNMPILPADKLVSLEIGYVVVGLIVFELENQPANVRVKETFGNAIGIVVVIHMFVVPPMFAGPHEDRVLESPGTENQGEQADRPACLKGQV